ncbi:MAG: SHOCT domain-containing protein [Chitinophagaceae bacterium]
MNFQTLNKQRKSVAIAALLGTISIFLPWIKVDAFMFEQSVNGFHGWGVLAFLAFVTSLVLSLVGTQTDALPKRNWLIVLVAGAVSLLIVLVAVVRAHNASSSINNTVEGLGSLFGSNSNSAKSMFGSGLQWGIWLALIASIGVVAGAWFLKSPGMTLASAVQGISLPPIPNINTSTPSGNTSKKYAELEKLLELKNKGAISEEEFQAMKKKTIGL